MCPSFSAAVSLEAKCHSRNSWYPSHPTDRGSLANIISLLRSNMAIPPLSVLRKAACDACQPWVGRGQEQTHPSPCQRKWVPKEISHLPSCSPATPDSLLQIRRGEKNICMYLTVYVQKKIFRKNIYETNIIIHTSEKGK